MTIYVIEEIKLGDLLEHFARYRLRPVCLERWRERGWLLWTERAEG